VDNVHTGSKPVGVVNITVKWSDAVMTLSFIVMEDLSKKVLFGTPVLKHHIETMNMRMMRMRTYSGFNVPFSELKEGKSPVTRVCSVKIGAEVKWSVVSNTVVVPGEPNVLTLEPDASALEFIPTSVLYDTKFIKPVVGKGLSVDLTSICCDRGCLIVRVGTANAFAKEVLEGMGILRSTLCPEDLAVL
jgi:hypothetical protein